MIHGLNFVIPGHANRRLVNGEADFVLMHPRQGLIVLEVKGGKYEVKDGEWYTYPGGKATRMDKSPFLQARLNRYAVTNYIADAGGLRGFPAGHAVIFTDGAPNGNLGPEAPGAITLDGRDLADLSTAVGRLCAHWFAGSGLEMSDEAFETTLRLLVPDAKVDAQAKYRLDLTIIDIRLGTERQIRFTDQQLAVIEATTGKRYAAVLGAAGTGKTLIAAKRAEKYASKGQQVLFLADQRYLESALGGQTLLKAKSIVLGTPEEVLAELESKTTEPTSGAIWERFLALHDSGCIFDMVIVDEAQSFEDDDLEALLVLSRGSCHLFADPYQRDSRGMWRPPGSPETFWLTENCRNSRPIAKLVARLGGALSPISGADGAKPQFIEIKTDAQDALGQVVQTVQTMLRAYPPEDIAILTCAPAPIRVAGVLRSAGIEVASRPGRPGVTLASALEFRGCEAPVVLLVAGPGADCAPETLSTNHYVATSRAVAHLTVLGRNDEWKNYQFMMESQ